GQVFAFEPSERGSWIVKNIELNNSVMLAQVTISKCFVSDHSETSKDGSVLVSIDDFALEKKLDRIDIVKIDVDGPENEVLDGAINVLLTMRPAICVEAHSRELLSKVREQLQKLNYCVRVVDPPPHEYRPIEYNPMVFGIPYVDEV
ncbi:MAG: FkbM family methyltransferase, partial [Pirellula staleyi]